MDHRKHMNFLESLTDKMAAKSEDEHSDTSFDSDLSDTWDEIKLPDYTQVIFSNVAQDVSSKTVGCEFAIVGDVQKQPSDCIGLFRVGEEDNTQCLASKTLAQIESDALVGHSGCIFARGEIPEVKCYCQFRYVNSEGDIYGASMPFFINNVSTKEMPEDLDENNEDFVMIHVQATEEVNAKMEELEKSKKELLKELEKESEKSRYLETSIQDLNQQIISLKDAAALSTKRAKMLNNEMSELKEKHQVEIQRLSEFFQASESKVEKLVLYESHLKGEIELLSKERTVLNDLLTAEKEQGCQDIKDLLLEHHQKITVMENKHKTEIQRLSEDFQASQSKVEKLLVKEALLRGTIESLRTNIPEDTVALSIEHAKMIYDEMIELKEKHQIEMQRLSEDFQASQSKVEELLVSEALLNGEIESLRTNYIPEDAAALSTEPAKMLNDRISELKEKHQVEIQGLSEAFQAKVEELLASAALQKKEYETVSKVRISAALILRNQLAAEKQRCQDYKNLLEEQHLAITAMEEKHKRDKSSWSMLLAAENERRLKVKNSLHKEKESRIYCETKLIELQNQIETLKKLLVTEEKKSQELENELLKCKRTHGTTSELMNQINYTMRLVEALNESKNSAVKVLNEKHMQLNKILKCSPPTTQLNEKIINEKLDKIVKSVPRKTSDELKEEDTIWRECVKEICEESLRDGQLTELKEHLQQTIKYAPRKEKHPFVGQTTSIKVLFNNGKPTVVFSNSDETNNSVNDAKKKIIHPVPFRSNSCSILNKAPSLQKPATQKEDLLLKQHAAPPVNGSIPSQPPGQGIGIEQIPEYASFFSRKFSSPRPFWSSELDGPLLQKKLLNSQNTDKRPTESSSSTQERDKGTGIYI